MLAANRGFDSAVKDHLWIIGSIHRHMHEKDNHYLNG